MKKKFKIKFDNGVNFSFFVNDLSGSYWGELWINNPRKINHSKYEIAKTVEFRDSSFEGFLSKVEKFVSDNFEGDFQITDF